MQATGSDLPPLGVQLRTLRETAGLTQEALAERASLTAKGIAALERGRVRRPRAQTLRALADALELTSERRLALFRLIGDRRKESARHAERPDPPPQVQQTPTALTTALLGRADDLAAVTALLSGEARLVTLTGPGGVGKTCLATAVATAVANSFPDGVVFVSLAPLSDPARVIPAIAQAIGLRETETRTQRDALYAWVRGRKSLLILDNLEHLLAAAPEIAALLAVDPGVTILTTSRAPLRLRGEQEWAVAPLPLPPGADPAHATDLLSEIPAQVAANPAIQLFVERAQAVDPRFALTAHNAATIAAICRRVDGLPLALELAAARVRLLPLPLLLARLDEALVQLTDGPRDLPAHQWTMRDTIAWSYELLPAAERQLFRQLAPFVGSWTLSAAGAICESTVAASDTPEAGTDLLNLLADLVEQSLVVTVTDPTNGETRYRLLEPIRQFAHEQLVAHGEETRVRDRHAAYYLALAEQAGPELFRADQARWLDRLEAEQDNFRSTLDWLLERGAFAEAVRLGWSLHRFWWVRGHLAEGQRWRAAVLPRRTELATPLRALALLTAGALTYAGGDHVEAGTLLDEALPYARQARDQISVTLLLAIRGLAALGRGEIGCARTNLTEALALAQQEEDRWSISMSLNHLGYIALAAGDRAAAAQLLYQASGIWREVNSSWDLAVNLNMRAAIAEWHGDYAQVAVLSQESLRLLAALGDTWTIAYALGRLAGVAVSEGKAARAARLLGAAERVREAAGTTILFASDRTLHERHIAAGRAQLSPDRFAAAWATGRAMPLDAIVAEALAAAG